MRKILLLVLSLISVQAIWSAPISKSQALSEAKKFFTNHGIPTSSEAKVVYIPETRSGEPTPWYAINADTKGFVIVSGDDRTVPVLGYSLNGSFSWDNVPENMKFFLEGYAKEIKWLQDNNISIKSTNETRATTDRSVISPMLQTQWNQTEPYNNSCPTFVNGARCVTGCVATAMAQVLYYQYQQHPTTIVSQTQAQIPAYQCRTEWTGSGHVSVESIAQGTTIDWANMLSSYSSDATSTQQEAVANLMFMCGASVQMNYADAANGGSSASTMAVPQALVNYFGFDASTTYVTRSDYSLADWNDLIYNELANNRVVLYGGQSRAGSGHAFVINGYEGNNYFDVNWGWGGMADGAFLLSVLAPSSTGTGGGTSTGGYNMDMDAVINAEPSHNGTESLGITTRNLTFSRDTISVSFVNSGLSEGVFNVGFAYVSSDGTLNNLTSTSVRIPAVNGASFAYYTASYPASELTTDGTYNIVPVARRNGDNTWQNLWSAEHYVQVVVSGGSVASVTEMPSHQLSASNMTVGSTRATYKLCSVTATISNDGTERFEGPLYLFASTTEDKGQDVAVGSVVIQPNATAEISLSWMPETAGTYTIWLCDDSYGENVLASVSDVVIEQAEDTRQRLTLTALNVDNADASTESTDSDGRTVTSVTGYAITGTYTIQAIMDIESADVLASLYRYDSTSNSYSLAANNPTYWAISGSAGATWNMEFAFNGLTDGKYMLKIAAGTLNMSSSSIDPEIWSDDTHCFLIGTATGINNVKTGKVQLVTIYNLQGMRLASVSSDSLDSYLSTLPQGIYIVNGKKILKR